MNENFDHWMNVLNNNLGRIAEALESRQCSDSHAPSSAGSGGTGPAPSVGQTIASGADATTSDSARRALADNTRPAWLTREAASTLPEGVEEIRYMSPTVMAAFPNTHTWAVYSKGSGKKPEWVRSSTRYAAWTNDQVYHLPPAAKGEGDAWSSGVSIQNDYLRMAPDTPNGKAFMWCKSNPLETLRRMVEEYVAAECERAVREAFPITAKAGRCAACKDTILDMGVRTGGEWYHNACAPKPDAGRAEGVRPYSVMSQYTTHRDAVLQDAREAKSPAPRPSPEEVAEECRHSHVQRAKGSDKWRCTTCGDEVKIHA